MLDMSKRLEDLSTAKPKGHPVPGRKTTTLSDDNLKKFNLLQKRFPGATDSKLLNVAIECLYDTIQDMDMVEKAKVEKAKAKSKVEKTKAKSEVETSIPIETVA